MPTDELGPAILKELRSANAHLAAMRRFTHEQMLWFLPQNAKRYRVMGRDLIGEDGLKRLDAANLMVIDKADYWRGESTRRQAETAATDDAPKQRGPAVP